MVSTWMERNPVIPAFKEDNKMKTSSLTYDDCTEGEPEAYHGLQICWSSS